MQVSGCRLHGRYTLSIIYLMGGKYEVISKEQAGNALYNRLLGESPMVVKGVKA